MDAEKAATHREQFRVGLGGDRVDQFAYQYARSTVLVTPFNIALVCECDRRNWEEAGREYLERGMDACWTSLGVTGDHMKRAEARRLAELSRERVLNPEEKARARALAAWLDAS